jgi:hypothetical protein
VGTCLGHRHSSATPLRFVNCGPQQPMKFSVLQIPNGPLQILRKSRSARGPLGYRICRSVGRRTAEPLGRKQVGRLLPGIASHGEDIAALGFVRQFRSRAFLSQNKPLPDMTEAQ